MTLLQNQTINRTTARLILKELVLNTNQSPIEIVTERNLTQISDDESLEKLCKRVLSENEDMVRQYKAGKHKVFKALIAIVGKKSEDRANMAKCTNILKNLLEK